MNIARVKITNYRSIKEIDISTLDSLIFLVGRNNAGKSNILRALDTFFLGKISIEDFPKNESTKKCIITVIFRGLDQIIRDFLKLGTKTIQLEVTKVFEFSRIPTILVNNKELGDYRTNNESIKEFRESFHNCLPLYYYIPALRNLKNEEAWKGNSLIKGLLEPVIKETSSTIETVDSYLKKIRELILKESVDMKNHVNDFLKDKLDDFKYLDIEITDVTISLQTQLNITNSLDQLIQASEQGAGSQNFIILALAQYYAYSKAKRPLILAFEEPEISLHPQGQRKILVAIQELLQKSSMVQILLTTHSSVMLGQEAGNIILIRKIEGETKIQKVTEELQGVVEELGLTGGDIFQSDALIVVEGRSDYLILKEWAKSFSENNPNSAWNALRITFFHLDGIYGIKEYKEEDFKQLALCSNLFAIMDSDREKETDDPSENIKEAKRKIEKSGGKPFILKYRTIESYFDEDAIKQILEIPYFGKYTPYDELKKILIHVAEANGKRFRASIEGRKIAKLMTRTTGIPEEIEQIFKEIVLTTAKRVGLKMTY